MSNNIPWDFIQSLGFGAPVVGLVWWMINSYLRDIKEGQEKNRELLINLDNTIKSLCIKDDLLAKDFGSIQRALDELNNTLKIQTLTRADILELLRKQ